LNKTFLFLLKLLLYLSEKNHFVKYFLTVFLKNIAKILKIMAHNVPAVYDVLAARIRALRSKDQGRQNVGGVSRGNGA
jgi:hypothetical protein